MKQIKIEKYKEVNIYYNIENGRLYFNFENRDREVKYLFEAKEIIDEPVWEDCNLEGYFIDGTFNDYIGLAKAIKRDIKSGIPNWKIKGRYDTDFKFPNSWSDVKVYLKNEETDKIYSKFLSQRNIVNQEENNLRKIINELKN